MKINNKHICKLWIGLSKKVDFGDAKSRLKVEKSIVSIVLSTKIDLIRTHLMVLSV